ncbi:MAG: hypothetical protein DPW14_17365 [Planctomycetes bacterium]|nr:hypothetical protein [Planctomycetota bacterium]
MRTLPVVLISCCLFAAGLFAAEQKLEFESRAEGRVTDTSGAPVAGVMVKVVLNDLWGCKTAEQKSAQERKRGRFPVGSVSGECNSDADGKFSLSVKVALKDGTLPQTRVKAADGSAIETCWVSVTLSAEKSGYIAQSWETVLFQDAPNRWTLPRFARALAIRGRAVTKGTREPLVGLSLGFLKPLALEPTEMLLTVTGNDGTFTFPGIDPVTHSGYVVVPATDEWALDPLSPLWSGEVRITGEGEAALGDVAFEPAGAMRITLRRELHQTFTAPLTLDMIEPARGRFFTVWSRQGNAFQFNRLPAGRYVVSAPEKGGTAEFSREFNVEGGKTSDLGTETLIDVEQTVEFSTKLIGSIRSNDGPLAGATIKCEPNKLWHFRTAKELEREEAAYGKFPEVTVSGEATSEDDGGFVIEVKVTLKGTYIPTRNVQAARGNAAELPYCHLYFTAQYEGFCTTQVAVMVWEGTRNRVDFNRISRACSISGRVLDSETGQPLANTPLVFGTEQEFYWGTRSAELVSATTDAEGHFKFTGLDANRRGRGIVMVDLDDYVLEPRSTGWENIDLNRNPDAKLGDLRFVRCGVLKGQMVNSDNNPLEAYFDLRTQTEAVGRRRQQTDRMVLQNVATERGAFRFSRLPVGKYQLAVTSQRYVPLLMKDIEIKAGETIDLGNLKLSNAMKVTLTADTGGNEEAGAGNIYATQLEGSDPEMELNGNIAGRGKREAYWRSSTAVFERMPAGRWRFDVHCQNYCPAHVVVELKSEDVGLTVKLSKGARLTVSVRDRGGNAVECTVLLLSTEHEFYVEFAKSGTPPSFEEVQRLWKQMHTSATTFVSQNYRADHMFERVTPGKYLPIAYINNNRSSFTGDLLELHEGSDVSCLLREPSASLKVTLKRGGKPVVNELVCAFSLAGLKDPLSDEFDPNRASVFGQYNMSTGSTDSEGVVGFKGLNVGDLCVVTAREHLCLTRGLGNPYKLGLMEVLRARVFKASVGENAQAIELPAFGGTWVSVDVRQSEGRDASGVLYPLPANCQTYQGYELAGRLEFGIVPKGRYEFIDSGLNGLVREIEVNAEGEQHFKFDEKLADVTVRLLDDKGEAIELAQVILVPEVQTTFAEPNVQAVNGRMQKDKSFLFRVPEGKFRALAMAGGRGEDEVIRVNSVKVDVKAGKNQVSIRIDENTGTIRLRLSAGRPSPIGAGMIRMMLVDDKGKVLETEGESWFSLPGNSPIICVPPGKYNLRFDGTVKETVIKNIEVRAGEWTLQEVRVEALDCPMFRVAGPGLTRELLASAEITYHQADGNKSQAPALACLPKPMMISQGRPGELALTLYGLDSDMTEVRIKIKGYKELKLRGWRDHIYNREVARLDKE